MKNHGKRIGALVLAVMMLLGMLNLTAFAVEEEPAAATEELVDVITIDPKTCQLSKNAGELAELAPGNHEKWIDRLVLPDYALDLYDWLEESVDGDGVADDLIDDASFANGLHMIGSFDAGSDYKQWDGYLTISMNAQFAYESFERDHPEVFWLNDLYYVTYEIYGSNNGFGWEYTVDAYFCYCSDEIDIRHDQYTSEAAIRLDMARVKNVVADVLSDSGSGVYAHIRYFNKYLTENNEYNTIVGGIASGTAPLSAWECTSALFGSTGTNGPVCEGYARAFKVLCDAAAIPCVLVDNNFVAGNPEPHMWNNVYVGNSWYGMDVTWNDPEVIGRSGAISGAENENYLLVGSNTVIDGEKFSSSHAVGNSPSKYMAYTNGPKLNGEKYTPASGEHTHVYEQSFVAPTCTTKGYTAYSCSCGITYMTDYVDALGHDWVEDFVQNNKVFYYCTRCDETKSTPVSGEEEWPFADWEWEVLKLVNKARAAEGLKPLTGFARLQQVSDVRAEELSDVFSHTRPNGSSCFTAMAEGNLPYGAAGENIAAGHTSPENVMWEPNYGWMYSEGHRANILDPDFQHMGVGYYYDSSSYYRHHWVQTFASMHFEKNTGFELVFPDGTEFKAGTSIEDMNIFAKVENSVYGTCYLPIIAEYCTGYNADVTGDQTVTVSALGFTEMFEISRGSHTHTYGNWYETLAPTCTAKGQERRDCTGCEMYETREVAATGHDYQDTVIDATCEDDGFTMHICAACGDSYKDSFVEFLGHDNTITTVEPTCTQEGYTEVYCNRCGNHYTHMHRNPLGHSFIIYISDGNATCTADGTKTAKCERCDVTDTVADPGSKKSHSYGNWTVSVAPACTAKGTEQRKCQNCSYSETREVAATGHDYKAVVTAPTCTAQGYTTYTCANCKDSYVDGYVNVIDHSWDGGKVTKEPTETETGIRTFTCTVCGQTSQETIPTLDHVHKYTEKVTDPTCTEQGYTTHACACGDDYVDSYVAAKGHSFGSWIVTKAPTCTEKGAEQRECSNCTHSESREVATTGHDYKATVTTPTCTEAGYTTYTCACGDSYQDDFITAFGHQYEKGICTVCGDVDENYVPEAFALYGSSMTLGNALDMNFFVYQSDIEGADNYAVITKHYADGREDAVARVDQKNWSKLGSVYYYFTFSGVKAKEMADKVEVVIYNAKGEAISEVFTDSVQGYARRMLDNPETIATHRTLYIEMLNYGAAAQAEFKYDVNNLANSVITAEEQAAYGMKDRTYVNQRQSDAAYYGTTLTLENQIVFNIFYNGSYVPEGAYAVATFTNHKGEKMEDRVNEFTTLGSWKYVSFKSLVVADCSEPITVKLYDRNGNLISTVVDSIEGYAARMTSVGPLYDAIMKFADAAYQYFHS